MNTESVMSADDKLCNTTKVHDVSGFLQWVKKMHSVTNESGLDFQRNRVFYRGQASSSWKLVPAIFRKENIGLSEHQIYQEACRRLWHELQSYDTYLDKLVYFQHYGLPTRLLDVTSNPLVALYFACCYTSANEVESKDGIVYCTNNMEDNSLLAELRAKELFMGAPDITYYLNIYEKKEQLFFEENYIRPIFFNPPASNLRVNYQNGAFIMAPILASRPTDINSLKLFQGDLSNVFDGRTAIIPCNHKESILQELAELGIDKGTLFVDAASKLESIVQGARRNSFLLMYNKNN